MLFSVSWNRIVLIRFPRMRSSTCLQISSCIMTRLNMKSSAKVRSSYGLVLPLRSLFSFRVFSSTRTSFSIVSDDSCTGNRIDILPLYGPIRNQKNRLTMSRYHSATCFKFGSPVFSVTNISISLHAVNYIFKILFYITMAGSTPQQCRTPIMKSYSDLKDTQPVIIRRCASIATKKFRC